MVIFNSIKSFNNLQRSKEEISLIQQELDRLHDFWINQKLVAENKLKDLQQINEQNYTLRNVSNNFLKNKKVIVIYYLLNIFFYSKE
jgi:flagellin-specific chaperone FliS